jgi:hypothetical protein
MTPRRLLAVLLSTCAILAAGCGGTTQKAGVSGDGGASLVRSGALAYVAVDSDLSSKQWTQVDDLLKKFPAHDKWIRELKQSLENNDPPLDYDRDVKDALGPEVDVAVVAEQGAKPAFAVMTKPDSIDKARALIKKENASSGNMGDKAVYREVDGWLVVSNTQQMIDRVLKGSDDTSLADDDVFKHATDSLPTDALAKAYVNGRQLAAYVPSLLGGAQTAADTGNPLTPLGLDKLDWIAAALDAKSDGIRFQAGVNGTGSGQALNSGAPYSSQLISGVPADSFAFATFRGGSFGTQLGKLRQNAQFGLALGQIEKQLGMRLDSVLALFSHEVAFYVRRGPGLPEFSLVLEEPDTQTALATLDRLAARVALATHGRVFTEQQAGLTVKSLAVGRVTVRWAGFDGRVLLTTAPTGIADYRSSGSKLGDDSGFTDALDAAGAPDKTSGLLYVDLHDSMQLLQSYFGLSGQKIPPGVQANLKPLQSFVAYSTANGDLTKSAAFLQLK